MANVKIDVSPGDFFDRLTILRIKEKRAALLQTPVARAKVEAYEAIRQEHFSSSRELNECEKKLERLNEKLWDLENRVRAFSHPLEPIEMEDYVSVARAIFSFNEERSALKREIDLLFSRDSDEIKSYGSKAPE